ncbi:MAG: hypothetical protein JWM12_95 [Ilumatobacteraceae bacterium]|nr:hypothetical protein [Ilumatobacteraceae bacterium]
MARPMSSLVSNGDAQGGRFHLLVEEPDWATCSEPDPAWPERTVLRGDPAQHPSNFEWDPVTGSLRLAHRESVSRHPARGTLRLPDERRGADRDRYGSWYWLSPDRRGVLRRAPDADVATTWWRLDDLVHVCAVVDGGFGPADPPAAAGPATLAGMAITGGHRLAVGLVDEPGGLLVFDLHVAGAPLVLRWPGDQVITPFDLAATAAGGVLVLDRVRRTWWELDANWRLVADVAPGALQPFQSVDPGQPERRNAAHVAPLGHPFSGTDADAVVDPVAITEGPGTVLVLDRPPAGPSAVVVADPDSASGVRHRFALTVVALDPTRPDLEAFTHDVIGQDLAWGAATDTTPLHGPLLYVADASTGGTEAYALHLAASAEHPLGLDHQPDELPMRLWEAKGLVASGGDVFYDAVGRWIPLEPFGICNMERRATLRTPTSFLERPVPGQPFDSGMPGCTWHRLFLDADLPNGCAVIVAARASDDPTLLEQLPFLPQPTPYLRGAGSELAWHDPWADVRRPASPRVGTWELLFQHVVGRYCQVELTFSGTGRTTPSLRAVRAWYPRFSYVRAYLPEVYQDEDESGRFLERMLANMEGLLTEHESLIDHAWMLADPRTAPIAALDWLASWVGLSLEPAWSTARRRFLLRHVDRMYRMRGTIGGLRSLLRLYLGCSLDEDVVFAVGPRTDDPARVVDRIAAHRFRVLIPAKLDEDQAAMVARIVQAARPAHAAFEIRSFGGLLVIGEAQLGIDTVVGASPSFVPVVIGGTDLAAGHLAADHPFEITDRFVSDRDRLGEIPAL